MQNVMINTSVTNTKQGNLNNMARVDFDGKNLVISVKVTPVNMPILRAIPVNSIYRAFDKCFLCPPNYQNISYLRAVFPDAEWTDVASKEAEEIAGPDPRKLDVMSLAQMRQSSIAVDQSDVTDFNFGTTPRQHQLELFLLARGKRYFAYTMDPRTGKTKPLIDEACWAFLHKGVKRMLVVCPNMAKLEWNEQIDFHSTPDVQHEKFVYMSNKGKKAKIELAQFIRWSDPSKLQWIIINVDSTSRVDVLDLLYTYVKNASTGVVYDESTTIKSPSAKRTRAAYYLGKNATFRRIMSGTAAPNGPADLFSQYKFLSPNILGNSFTEFARQFLDTIPLSSSGIVKYVAKDLTKLSTIIAPYTFRRTFNDVAKYIPEIQKIRIPVELTPIQSQIYKDLQNDFLAEFEGREISIKDVLTLGMRLMQITGGFVKWNDQDKEPPTPIAGKNAKIETLIELLEKYDNNEKMVIWARFRAELDLIYKTLCELYGAEKVGLYHGGTKPEERERVRQEFQNGDLRFFVGNAQAAGMAIPLWRANIAIYYSNSFDYLYRKQSEDRIVIDRPDKTVLTYYDLVAPNTWDDRCLRALTAKKDMAAALSGDNLRELFS